MKRRVVLATRNEGKVREMQALFASLDWELVSQSSLNIPSAPETGATFIENALGKARHVSEVSGLSTLADDSGLVVDALGGAPGIFSARYAGPLATDQENNEKLLAELHGASDRRAHFYCALVFLEHATHPAPALSTGRWSGRIGEAPAGDQGFGYDPLFIPDGGVLTAAQLSAHIKNDRSHRALAARALLALLES
jgi:XTP/dITP diphosphohydrolase